MSESNAAPVVVVGGGLAGLSFISTLRQSGYDGKLTLVCEETEPAYDRPPLSKEFLVDGNDRRLRLDDSCLTDVDVLRGVRAQMLDLQRRTLCLDNGTQLLWGTLVLATGARPRLLPALEATNLPVLTLRTLDDARRLRELILPGRHMLLVGAGVIGLELAATACSVGAQVTVLETQPRVMARCAPPTLSQFIQARHLAAGVDLRLGRAIESCSNGAVVLDDGGIVTPDFIVAGIGVRSNDELALAAGIRCDDGIYVDTQGRTSAPGVFAIGDVARQIEPVSGEVMRIETWSNAQNQSAAVARSWLNPATAGYSDVPWYWSDQYDLRIQGTGMPSGEREVVRGDLAVGRFTLLQLRGRRLVGASCVNNAKDFATLRKLIGREFDAIDTQWAATDDLRKIA